MGQAALTNSERLIMYWRNSLVDGYRLQELSHSVEVDQEVATSGNIGPEKASEVKAKYKEAMRSVKEKGKEAATANESLPVLVCPIKMVKRYSHYQENTAGGEKGLIPLWIPALISTEGQLQPRENYFPWIARNLLEPTTQKGVTIGDIEDIEKFLATHDQDKLWDNWEALWAYANDMLKSLPDGELSLPGFTVVNERCYIMPDVEVRGAAMNAIRVMDSIIESKTIPPLLAGYASLHDAPEKPAFDQEGHVSITCKHSGQMNGEFSLSPSQRGTMHHYLDLGNGEILAVNGPPGTGKTTLMHSIIATEWVNAALNQSYPPIIVTASSNNQAVTNMIDSFGKVSSVDKVLMSERWIPGVKSYGLYSPSGIASRREESTKYQKATPGDNSFPAQSGFPGEVEKADFIDRAEKYFLEKYNEFTGKPASNVVEAIAALHHDLAYVVTKIRNELSKQEDCIKINNSAEDTISNTRAKYGIGPNDDLINKLNLYKAKYEAEISYLQKSLSEVQAKLRVANSQYNDVCELAKTVESRKNNGGFLSVILEKLGFKRKESSMPLMVQRMMERSESEIAVASQEQTQALERLKNKENQLKTLLLEIEVIQNMYEYMKAEENAEPLESAQGRLDTNERYEAFLLATHYWEGRWLLEVRKMQDMAQKKIYLTPEQRVTSKWRRYAMLTPAVVSTLYVTPRLFTAWHRDGEYLEADPLFESIDLLIIDEAGQVPPELAAAAFALAKRAVVVGDVLQIEPVYNITRYVDQGNLIRHGLIENRDQYPAVKAVSASGGNAMAVAKSACRYWLTDENGSKYSERGMFLSEHRRCLDKIISYCNELAYNGRLIPMRGDEIIPGALQQFNYMHVDGTSSRTGSSRKNDREAKAILDWLLLNSDYIVQKYGNGEKPLKDLVAVLMPFTAQKRLFLQAVFSLKRYEPLRGITFGTIHALQGAERDVVIFSPVYTKEDGDPGEFFFNNDLRMLNVAVSRAKEAFVVMGDMDVFKKSSGPAGLLAKYLFEEEANNLGEVKEESHSA